MAGREISRGEAGSGREERLRDAIYQVIPTGARDIFGTRTEDRAPYFLRFLNALPENEKTLINRNNQCSLHAVREYPPELQDRLSNALVEAWGWLEREGFLAPAIGAAAGWFHITERGMKQKDPADWQAHQNARLLPRKLLHPTIERQVWPNFLRGKYDTAVFDAFKEVEIAVRTAGKFDRSAYGVPLMAEAFKPSAGPLTDKSLLPAEQEATRNLFTGTIGAYRNLSGHHHTITDPVLAAELIVLASHLFRIVGSRKSRP